MRRYVVVSKCELANIQHHHIETDTNTYCHATGTWFKDAEGLTYKELKEKWKKQT